MWKTIAAVGATAAIIGGAGTAAFAASGTATPTPLSASSISSASDISASTSTTPAGKHPAANRLRRAVHATWVSENKNTKRFTTHDAIRGQVIAVSATLITVRAADNVTETYVINVRTKVYTRALKTGASTTTATRTAASIADVKAGDPVFVAGIGTTTLTARRVVDITR